MLNNLIPYHIIHYCEISILAVFSSEGPYHYIVMNNTNIIVIDQMWYQMIGNDESNNFVIENLSPKLIFIPGQIPRNGPTWGLRGAQKVKI